MDSVKVLIQGYAKKPPGGRWDATSATVLVRSNGKNVLVDPGMFPEGLKAALEKEHLQTKDIDIVTYSHSHPDHTKNKDLFDKSNVFDPFKQYKKLPEDLVIPGTEIKIIYTPGHAVKHVAFVANTAEGRYAIAGDAIWWVDGEEQKTDIKSLIEHVDPVGKDHKMIQESRKKLFRLADYVIPGHGRTFRIK